MSSIIYNGHEIQDLIINGNQAQLWLNGQKLYPTEEPVDPYNPLGLPPFTIRCKFSSGYTPTMGDSQTLVDADENVWDITRNLTSWASSFSNNSNLLEVLGANTSGVTDMRNMFAYCTSLTTVTLFDTSSCTNMTTMFNGTGITTVPLFDTSSCTSMDSMFSSCRSLTSIPLFDTSSCTDMSQMFMNCSSLTSVPLFDTSSCTDMTDMFRSCRSLTSIPLFDTSSCTNMSIMFWECFNVQSGALALYQQASTQSTVPSHDQFTFGSCGRDTVTGAAELAQIPSSWGGTGA